MKQLMKTLCFAASFAGLLGPVAHADSSGDTVAIQACLAHWGTTPFKKTAPVFKSISNSAKVLGVGGDVRDEAPTKTPALVLIKPNGNVLSKASLSLLNPNGWYCLKGKVAALGASAIHLDCLAHFASSGDGATILGAGDPKAHGVTALGSTRVYIQGKCAKPN